MIVCIAEKPSVAREIAQILGATQSHDGYIEGNNYQVTWTFGHLCELKYPEDYTPQWHTWSLGALPMIPSPFGIRLKQDKGIQKQFNIIKQLMKNAERIINCGDAGQEGELIQRWVMQKVGVTCPVQRLWISSLTEESIREGFNHLKDEKDYQSLYEAGLCRAIGDWILGMNATRLYTLKYGHRERQAPPLSIGRVQTPTLALIVKRQEEIDHFVPEPYWVLATKYRETLFVATKGKFQDEEKARALLTKIEGKPFEVTNVSEKNGREAPPRLFDLTSLQVECNQKFAFSADLTLSLIQSLYEKKVTTYPRVDTTYLSEDIYPKCGPILNGLNRYQELLQPLRGKKLLKSKKVFDSTKVTDHHAIIPTGVAPNGLTDQEMMVFDIVARRFIAVFYPDCLFTTTTVLGSVEDESFKVTGKQIKSSGWREVYARDKKSNDEDTEAKEEECLLPNFVKGEQGEHQPQLTKKMTTPPKPFTEATLLRAMETAGKLVEDETLREALKENGIGRPSTRAAIIETLFKRRYIHKARKNLLPTTTGIQLIHIIHEELLKSAELTGIWERKLREIEYHRYSASQFVTDLKEMVQTLVTDVLRDNQNRYVEATEEPQKPAKRTRKTTKREKSSASDPKIEDKQAPASKALVENDGIVGKPCPLCHKGHLIKGKTAYGCSEYKSGCTFRLPFTEQQLEENKA